MTADPRFYPRLRYGLGARHFPDWTGDAWCRSSEIQGGNGPNRPGFPWDVAFNEDHSAQPGTDLYGWTVGVTEFMEGCAECPVREMCIKYAFEINDDHRQFGVFGGVPGRVREGLGWRGCFRCKGSGWVNTARVDGKTLRWKDYSWLRPSQPGFRCTKCLGSGKLARPDRVERCNAWFEAFCAKKGWKLNLDERENLTA